MARLIFSSPPKSLAIHIACKLFDLIWGPGLRAWHCRQRWLDHPDAQFQRRDADDCKSIGECDQWLDGIGLRYWGEDQWRAWDDSAWDDQSLRLFAHLRYELKRYCDPAWCGPGGC